MAKGSSVDVVDDDGGGEDEDDANEADIDNAG